MRIVIETIDHKDQRYPTTGDWRFLGGPDTLLVRVSNMGDWRYEALVGIHEAIEAVLCRQAGIDQDKVDLFDVAYEVARPADDISEPGDHPDAPYYKQHQLATGVERILAAELEVNWASYEAANLALYEP